MKSSASRVVSCPRVASVANTVFRRKSVVNINFIVAVLQGILVVQGPLWIWLEPVRQETTKPRLPLMRRLIRSSLCARLWTWRATFPVLKFLRTKVWHKMATNLIYYFLLEVNLDAWMFRRPRTSHLCTIIYTDIHPSTWVQYTCIHVQCIRTITKISHTPITYHLHKQTVIQKCT